MSGIFVRMADEASEAVNYERWKTGDGVEWISAARYDALAAKVSEQGDVAQNQLALICRQEDRISKLEEALDWALRYGAYADDYGGFLTREMGTGKLKKLPPFPPLIPTLEESRRRVCGLQSDAATEPK